MENISQQLQCMRRAHTVCIVSAHLEEARSLLSARSAIVARLGRARLLRCLLYPLRGMVPRTETASPPTGARLTTDDQTTVSYPRQVGSF